MRNRLTLLLAAAALFCFAARSNAQFITFATESGTNTFQETNTGSGFTVGLVSGGANGTFQVLTGSPLLNLYAAALGLPLNTQISLDGVVLTTSVANATGPITQQGLPNGSAFTQPLGAFNWDIRTSVAVGSVPANTSLLSGTSTSSRILGALGGSLNVLVATDSLGEGVDFHSGIATVDTQLNTYLQHAFQWSATGRNPDNAYGAGGFLNSGTGSFVGNFAVNNVPEPSSLALLLGSGIGGSLFALRRRRR